MQRWAGMPRPAHQPYLGVVGLQCSRYRIEFGQHVSTNRGCNACDSHRDRTSDQPVFNCRGATVVLQKALKEIIHWVFPLFRCVTPKRRRDLATMCNFVPGGSRRRNWTNVTFLYPKYF